MLKTLNRLLSVILIVAVIGVAVLWITRRETQRPEKEARQTQQKIVTQETTNPSSSTDAEPTTPGPQNRLLQAADSSAFQDFVANQPDGPGRIGEFFKSQGLGADYNAYLNLFAKMFQDQYPGTEAAALEPSMRETLLRIAAEMKATSEEEEMSQEVFFQDVMITFLIEERNTPWLMTYFEGDILQASIWAKGVLRNPIPPSTDVVTADTIVPTVPTVPRSTEPIPREMASEAPQAPQPEPTPLPDAASFTLENLMSETENAAATDSDLFEFPTEEHLENVLNDRFSSERIQRAMQTMNQHGPIEGLRKLKESDPEIATQFERLIPRTQEEIE